MVRILIELVAGGAVAWLVTVRLAHGIAARGPLFRRNYRRLEVAAAAGMAPVLGALAGIGVVTLIAVFGRPAPIAEAAHALVGAAALLGFAFLGLWDDVAASSDVRGWRAHLASIRRGPPTTGAIKLVGGGAIAILIGAAADHRIAGILLHAALIASAANVVNLLDLRPGRACKFFLVPAAGLLILALASGDEVSTILVPVTVAVIAFCPLDLRERAMLGDAGANALGALLGTVVVHAASDPVEVAVLAALAALQVAGERPGLSRLIDIVPPLRRFDRAGRAPE